MDPLTRKGTLGGTLTIFFANISSAQLRDTIILSVVGAVVSFSVSLLLRKLMSKRKPPDQ